MTTHQGGPVSPAKPAGELSTVWQVLFKVFLAFFPIHIGLLFAWGTWVTVSIYDAKSISSLNALRVQRVEADIEDIRQSAYNQQTIISNNQKAILEMLRKRGVD